MPSQSTRRLMPPEQFHEFFLRALTDPKFQAEVSVDPFGAAERYGLNLDNFPPEIRSAIAQKVGKPVVPEMKNNCSLCHICHLCLLCGELDAGSEISGLMGLTDLSD